ncbi:MAG: glycosyltransferase family 4 protein [Dehalococcoidia bacterium]
MRLCFLLCQGNMYSGGQGIYLYYVTRELARMGHEVEAIVGPPYPQLDEGVRLHKVPTYSRYWLEDTGRRSLPSAHPLDAFQPLNFYELATTMSGMFSVMAAFSVRAYEKFRELTEERSYDVVHDNQVLGYGTLLIKNAGIPVVATIHHPLSVDRRNRILEARSLLKKAKAAAFFPFFMQEIVARRLDRIISVSTKAARSVRAAFGLREEQVTVVENGVDAEQCRPLPDVERDPRLIVFVGNSEDENKGVRHLIEALAMLGDERWELAVVDDRDRLHLLPRLAFEHRVSSISYTGRLSSEELVRLYNRAGMIVAPSLYEGFGLPAAEAMACATPVVATPVGAHEELVRDGETGLLVPPGDSGALAQAIQCLLSNPDLGRRMGAAGRDRVVRRFTWRRAATELVDVYQDVLAKRAGRS